jgi:hypothetical protein
VSAATENRIGATDAQALSEVVAFRAPSIYISGFGAAHSCVIGLGLTNITSSRCLIDEEIPSYCRIWYDFFGSFDSSHAFCLDLESASTCLRAWKEFPAKDGGIWEVLFCLLCVVTDISFKFD